MQNNTYIYIGIMALVTYLIRVLPLTIIKKQIKNQFIQSFLYYVPYVTLAVMTFPAITLATKSPISGIAAFIVGVAVAFFGWNLFKVAVSCCITVFLMELVLPFMGLI